MALSPAATLNALLFSSGEPILKSRLPGLLDIPAESLREIISQLSHNLGQSGLALIETDSELELRTSPDAADAVKKLRESELSRDIGKAGLETMALVLYRGGATRSQIDWVRGVNSGAAIRSLTLRGLIERTEDPSDKRRALYLPTVDALAHLGVGRREDLPRYAEFTAALAEHEEKVAIGDAPE